eukprot:3113324-Rhodomonas_salina.5
MLALSLGGTYCAQITITKFYSISNLFDDIKLLYKTAGLKGKPVTFLFTDAEVRYPASAGAMLCSTDSVWCSALLSVYGSRADLR